MLGKLFKYDNKALFKTVFPLGIGIVILSILGSAVNKLGMAVNELDLAPSAIMTIQAMTTIVFVFSIVAIISASFISLFLIIQRYYKNLFTDEGYLTFTLPVKTSGILFSKLVSAVLWMAFIVVCVIGSVLLIITFGTSLSFVNHETLETIRLFFAELLDLGNSININLPLAFTQIILTVIAAVVEQILLLYLAVTIGSQIAKRHKIIASIGMYFAIYSICQVINIIPVILIGITIDHSYSANIPESFAGNELSLILLFALSLSIVYSLAFYFINRHILKNKLNLE